MRTPLPFALALAAAACSTNPDVLRTMGERFAELAVVATRERERQSELSDLAPLLVPVPVLDHDIGSLADLAALTGSFE